MTDWTTTVIGPAVVAAGVSVVATSIIEAVRRRDERMKWLRDQRHEKYQLLTSAGRRLIEAFSNALDIEHVSWENRHNAVQDAFKDWSDAADNVEFLARVELQACIMDTRTIYSRYARAWPQVKATRLPTGGVKYEMHGVDIMDDRLRIMRAIREVDAKARRELGLPNPMNLDEWLERTSESVGKARPARRRRPKLRFLRRS